MATIRKRCAPRGKAVWQAQIIRIGYRAQHRTFATKTAAMEWTRSGEATMDRGEWADRTEGDRTTLSTALERYVCEIVPQKALSVRIATREHLDFLVVSRTTWSSRRVDRPGPWLSGPFESLGRRLLLTFRGKSANINF